MRLYGRLWLPLLLLATPAAASDLYSAVTIVTGMDLRGRSTALNRTLAAVLAKASGNPAWLTDERAEAIDARGVLLSFVYTDRESALPKHDEQGTRDRPYDLLARYDPAGVDDLLRGLGDVPWPEPRPTLVVDVTITPRGSAPTAMRADTDRDEPHRAALLEAAGRFGLSLLVPASIAPFHVPETLPVLHGTMTWSDTAPGWVSEWRMEWNGVARTWGIRGVGFDAAYRDAAGGAVRLLSGH